MIERVAPMCEVLDCGGRADYFWHFGKGGFDWVPICAAHATGFAEHLRTITVAPLAEMAGPEYQASAPRPPVDARSPATRIHDL